MSEKLTDELLKELIFSNQLEDFLDQELKEYESVSDYLNRKLLEKQLRKSEVVRKSGLNHTHAYQVFSGDRKASRNKLLQLAFVMDLNLKETQRLLKNGGMNELYCKVKRDAIIIHCLINKLPVTEADDVLDQLGEPPLSEK